MVLKVGKKGGISITTYHLLSYDKFVNTTYHATTMVVVVGGSVVVWDQGGRTRQPCKIGRKRLQTMGGAWAVRKSSTRYQQLYQEIVKRGERGREEVVLLFCYNTKQDHQTYCLLHQQRTTTAAWLLAAAAEQQSQQLAVGEVIVIHNSHKLNYELLARYIQSSSPCMKEC